jgi:hypothetical protein
MVVMTWRHHFLLAPDLLGWYRDRGSQHRCGTPDF